MMYDMCVWSILYLGGSPVELNWQNLKLFKTAQTMPYIPSNKTRALIQLVAKLSLSLSPSLAGINLILVCVGWFCFVWCV